MEGSVGMVDGSIAGGKMPGEEMVIVGEKKPVEDIVILLGPDGPIEMEDEVFEEAIDAQELLQAQGTKPELGDDSFIGDGNGDGETPGVLRSGEVLDNTNAELEDDTFEEAIGVPTAVGSEKELPLLVDEQKSEDLMAGESLDGVVVPDKIDEGGTGDRTGTAEANAVEGTKLSRNVDEGDVKSKAVIDEPEIGDSEKADLDDTLVDGKLEAGDLDKLKEGFLGFDQAVEFNLQAMPEDERSEKEQDGSLVSENKDDGTGESVDASAGILSKPEDDKNEPLVHRPTIQESEELKDTSDEIDSIHGLDKGEQAQKSLVVLNSEDHDNMNREVKEPPASSDLKHNGESDKPQDTSADLFTSVKELLVPETGKLSLQKSKVEMNGDTEAAKPEMEVDLDFSSQPDDKRKLVNMVQDSNGVAEDSERKAEKGHEVELDESSQPQQADKKEFVNKVQDSNGVAKDSERKEEKDQEAKNNTNLDREYVIQPPSSSSAKSEESEKKVDKGPEEKQMGNLNQEREIPFGPLPSSSANSTSPAMPARPAGLGRAASLFEPASRVVQPPRVNGTVSHVQTQQIEEPANGEAEENDETREKLQMIRVKFLRLAHRLGQTPHNVVVAQVLYRLGLAEQLQGRNGGRVGAFSFDRASAMAEQLEAAGNEPLDFSCTIMVLGKTGVGKSATINSIFDEVKFSTDAFQTGTKKVQDVVGTVHGIKVRVIDTPGLLPSWSDKCQNEKILHSVKRFIKKTPPDIVLYLDRLDMQSRDFGDMPLLRTISEIFGPSIWFNAIVVLTHAASAPPEGPNGTAPSYDMFVTQRSHVVQQAIRQAAGDMRLMNPVSLVENHSACRTNRAGQRVLPNGQVWKPHLLLLSFASKILAEANALLKLQDTPPGKPFATRSRAPPLPFLLSSLLQSRPQVKLPEEQFGDDDGLDEDLDESSDSDDDVEYDELPPFKRLTKDQIAMLSKGQRNAYFDELEYREKLFMKKQLKEERRRRKMMKKMAAAAKDLPRDYGENAEESGGAASVPVPVPDLALPASFDSDNPTHRYRYLDSSNQWLVRPVLETHGWDHDVGYEGINVERLFVVKDKVPISFSGQVTKDKKDANVQMELASSLMHGEGKATSLGFDMQTVGKDLAYTLRSETRFSNFRKNKATAGLSVTLLGDALSAGLKVEDKFIPNKRLQVVMTGGAMTSWGDVAYGGSLEAQLRDKDHPLGRSLSTLGLSVMDWHGDLALGCNIQSQIPVGRSTNLIARANLNNRGAGQVSVRLNSSEQLQIVLVAVIPLLKKLLGYHQTQFGQ
ncbi:hypothetical protein SLEP1_g31011 [Rubroshorea leprosula]|uniref:AIG1-type G domain-containing protein n=1 Tax=Rubroshorea leprosula TaxID=152421 RepID=A0AAV5K9V6_9ROSI|nr:hypothetical protein SLEP1_g31011 [Rubroshorea leprosula]